MRVGGDVRGIIASFLNEEDTIAMFKVSTLFCVENRQKVCERSDTVFNVMLPLMPDYVQARERDRCRSMIAEVCKHSVRATEALLLCPQLRRCFGAASIHNMCSHTVEHVRAFVRSSLCPTQAPESFLPLANVSARLPESVPLIFATVDLDTSSIATFACRSVRHAKHALDNPFCSRRLSSSHLARIAHQSDSLGALVIEREFGRLAI